MKAAAVLALPLLILAGVLWGVQRHWFEPQPTPLPATIDLAAILRVYNEDLTRQVLDGKLTGPKVTEFLGTIDTAVREAVLELATMRHAPIFLKDAVLSPSQDLTEEVLLLMARRHPELRTKLMQAVPPSPSAPAASSAPASSDSPRDAAGPSGDRRRD
jgi:hypothetical protein